MNVASGDDQSNDYHFLRQGTAPHKGNLHEGTIA